MKKGTHDDVLRNFQYGLDDCQGSSLKSTGDELRWYNTTIAIRRDWGRNIPYLINGDRMRAPGWGGANWQNIAIRVLEPSIQVPFSALRAAGLMKGEWGAVPREELKIIDFRKDTSWHECSQCGKKVKQNHADDYNYWHIQEASSWTPERFVDPICNKDENEKAVANWKHLLGAALLRFRRRYFLSSTDTETPRNNYFLSELGEKAYTVDQAFYGLKPPEVRILEHTGTKGIIRQGEIFLIPTDKGFVKSLIKRNVGGHVRIFNGRHFATQVVEIKEGDGISTYIRGTLRHSTQGNWGGWGSTAPDHFMVKMGEVWHKAVKNTAKASWQASGGID